ncbi:MAG: aminotransferase class I/II-fold pyridoxal phosphate-dependent enzyme [Ardenticatenaceae bacterium]|nr:aminotransferase class I/II-fold pyridoxal phosphate-dependent enzyme [Ardenticatenaceae bacterium]
MTNHLAQRVRGFGTTIFQEMTELANAHNAVNLGQGFPDFAAPDFVKAAAQAAIAADVNQYAPGNGRLRLRQAIAADTQRRAGIPVNPETDVVVTVGATEAIFAAILGLVNPGEEVILIEPVYDSYVPAVIMAGGVPRFLTLRPPHWKVDIDALAQLFTPQTRAIVLNTPHNPIGKVYSRNELQMIAELCYRHDVVAVVDEVYEYLVYDDNEHISLAGLPGMRPRTLTISSLGKTFSVTGWKVGWAVGPRELITAVFRTHQFITYSGAAPLQEAAAVALETAVANTYYADLQKAYQARRDFLVEALQAAGLRPFVPQGAYFVMADISHLGFADDRAFCRYLTTEIGVAAIPPSAFYHHAADGAGMARFAFCKSDPVLAEAAQRLRRLGKTAV